MYPTLAIAVFNGITSAPVKAHPFEPLPPVPLAAPGTPDPAYCVYVSSHPLMVLVGPGNPGVGDENPPESIVVPGAASQTPATPVVVVNLMSKLARLGLANAKVKYCVLVRFPPIDKFGPTGKYPVDKSTAYRCSTPYRTTASGVSAMVCAPDQALDV